MRDKLMPVFACDVHDECTERKTGTRPAIRSCLTCQDHTSPPGIKVAILSPFFAFGGGVEQWIHSLLVYTSTDIDWIGIGLLTDDRGMYEWDKQGVDYILPHVSVSIGKRACSRLAYDADVLIAWGVESIDRWFDTRPDKPIVFVNHGQSDWSRRLLAGAKDWADHFVAVGEAALELDPAGVLIPNGVDLLRCERTADLRRAARESFGIPADALVVGQIGRLVTDKDTRSVGRAVAELGESAWGLLVGRSDARYIAEIRDAAGGRLTHVPPTVGIGAPLSAMDCFLFSSFSEGFGLAVAEAWASGVPVVSTRVGVVERHPDMVVEVPKLADGPTLAAAVRAAISFDNRQRVRSAQQLVREQYSAERMAGQWRDFLLKVHRERNAAAP